MINKLAHRPLYFSIWLLGALLVSVATYQSAEQLRTENKTASIETKFAEMNQQLDAIVARHFERLRLLTTNPHILSLFNQAQPDNPETLALLTGLKDITKASIIYILDRQGTVISCSTYGKGKTLTGKNYSFRPYFINAINDREALYPALGVTTGRRGLYLSAPIKNDAGTVLGVAVIKIGLTAIDRILHNQEGINLLISPDGVIFACNKKEWLFHTTGNLTKERHAQLIASKQFSHKPLVPLPWNLEQPQLTIETTTYSIFSAGLVINGWSVVRCSNIQKYLELKPVQRRLLLSQFIFTILLLTIIMVLVRNVFKLKEAESLLKEHHDHLQETITSRTKELTTANTNLTLANKAKSEFLANMSHEIRTPMNAIIGFTDILLGSTPSSQQRQYLKTISQAGATLLTLINDILDFSKIEAGKLDIEIRPFDLGQIMETIINIHRERAEAKDLTLSLHLPTLKKPLRGDPDRLSQIITNLISNSIKFTKKGTIQLHISRKEEDEQQITLLFKVTDDGIGISTEQQSKIFESFTQADASVTRSYGGTGLGLTISNQLIKLLGGSHLYVTSAPGQGATFSFTLTFAFGTSITAKQTSTDDGEPLPPCKILLVEDNLVNIKLATVILENRGHTIVTAENGMLAVERFQAESFDLIFMDMQMPIMDGITATKKIRAIEENDPRRVHPIPIIAITANAMQGDRQRCLDAGMNDYITKPIKIEQIITVAKRVLFQTGIDQ